MKLLYTHENRLIVSNIANILEQAGFDIHLKNEFSGAAAGELILHETWLEIWIDEPHFKQASVIVENSLKDTEDDWYCSHCGEQNPSSFELCWQCHSAPSTTQQG